MPRSKKPLVGRPVTVDASVMISYRVDKATVDALEELAIRWECSKSEVVRRAVKTARDKR